MCAPSCHDCSTLRAWWEEDEERRCRFFKNVVGSNELPPSQCTPEIANFVIRLHVEAPSMWAIFPLQVTMQKISGSTGEACSISANPFTYKNYLYIYIINNGNVFNDQDLLALKEEYTTRPATEETINDPTNPKHYWRYRMCLILFLNSTAFQPSVSICSLVPAIKWNCALSIINTLLSCIFRCACDIGVSNEG